MHLNLDFINVYSPIIKLFLGPEGPTSQGVPKNYTLKKAKEATDIHSFGEDLDVISKSQSS